MRKFSLVYITAPSKKEAKRICQTLLSQRLAACCNIFKIDSMYWWTPIHPPPSRQRRAPGKIEKSQEFGIFVKTKKSLIEKIIKRVKQIHSYSTPCIISFNIEKGNKDFLKWIDKETR
ncbi:MAG: divalent-cation tolerance protein CutA [Minisyncoccales bacterium]